MITGCEGFILAPNWFCSAGNSVTVVVWIRIIFRCLANIAFDRFNDLSFQFKTRVILKKVSKLKTIEKRPRYLRANKCLGGAREQNINFENLPYSIGHYTVSHFENHKQYLLFSVRKFLLKSVIPSSLDLWNFLHILVLDTI